MLTRSRSKLLRTISCPTSRKPRLAVGRFAIARTHAQPELPRFVQVTRAMDHTLTAMAMVSGVNDQYGDGSCPSASGTPTAEADIIKAELEAMAPGRERLMALSSK